MCVCVCVCVCVQEQPCLVLPDESTVVMEVLDKVPLVVPVRVALGWRLLSPKVAHIITHS